MKIELEYPFTEYWEKGYLVCSKEPRWNVVLYNTHTHRSTISLARYIVCVWIGQMLTDDVMVDHINGNQLDDRFENFQLLSVRENNIKGLIENGRGEKRVKFICGVCGEPFDKRLNNTHLIPSRSHMRSTYCSRSCGGRAPYHGPSEVVEIYIQQPDMPI